MAAKEPTNYQFAGTGPGLSYIGGKNGHAYAFSGFADFGNSEVTMLQFTTGNEYCILQIMPTRSDQASTDSQTRIFLNSEKVFSITHRDGNRPAESAPYNILIPSFSNVSIVMIALADTTLNGAVMLTGRAYGAE